MQTIEVKYLPGDAVVISDPQIPGRIDTVTTDRDGSNTYGVVWWVESAICGGTFCECELEVDDTPPAKIGLKP